MRQAVLSPAFGAHLEGSGVRFRLWAPDCRSVSLCIETPRLEIKLSADAEGWCDTFVIGVKPGTRYRYRINDDLYVPDPASRFQPDDVHGASEIVDPSAFTWTCAAWLGRPWEDAVIYELHVGTFAPEGTFRGVGERLDALADLGVTVIELMPVADFPGARDWGYNGVALFAPDSRYGRPEDLKALIDAAHARGLMVLLDVVYNHFGPEGNYLNVYARRFFNEQRQTPWGTAIDFDGPASRWVREFFVQNALHWLHEYRFDGLRLDAVHAIDDRSPCHFLDELARRVREATAENRHVHLVLENDRNEAQFLRPTPGQKAICYTAQWNDDMHHAFHVLLTGETASYYVDYAEEPGRLLTRCLTEGFAYQGDCSRFRGGERRGEPSDDLPPGAFINFLQNHDQIGNRAFGERLAALTTPAALRAAAAVLLLAPSPPLLFMGEEWAAPEPFLFFCDLGDELREGVREGRRREFAHFTAFQDAARAKIPDPTAEETYQASILDWHRRESPPHAAMLDHYRSLLALRRREIVPRLRGLRRHAGRVLWQQGAVLAVRWQLDDGDALFLCANLSAVSQPAPPRHAHVRVLFAYPADVVEDGKLLPWSVSWSLAAAA